MTTATIVKRILPVSFTGVETMISRGLGTFSLLVLLAPGLGAQSASDLYQQALRKERAGTDLAAAIQLYQRVVAGGDRNLGARALIRIGETYERMGRQEALQAYRRVVRDFADQQDAARVARERLAALEPKTTSAKNSRTLAMQLVVGDNFDTEGMPSPDGRFLTFTDWQHGGNLALRDLQTGTNRLITQSGNIEANGASAESSSVSRDGKRVAYFWTPPNPRWWLPQLRIINTDGTGERILITNEDSSLIDLRVYDFTPDGSAVAAFLNGYGTRRVGLVSTSDGSFRLLADDVDPVRMSVSPDGKWVAYDVLPDSNAVTRDIVIVASDAGKQSRIRHPAGNQSPIWTPDGKYLLFTSARGGTFGLWAVRIVDGVVTGEPLEVKGQMPWGFTPMGFGGGTLFYSQNTGGGNVLAIEFDQQAGRVRGAPVNLVPTYEGMNMLGAWTADGRWLTYVSRRGAVPSQWLGRLVVRDMRTGEEKEFARPNMHPVLSRPAPSPDGRYIVAKVQGIGAGHQLKLLDTRTEEIRTLAVDSYTSGAFAGNGIWSHDGSAILYPARISGNGGVRTVIMRYDVATNAARELVGTLTTGIMDRTLTLSPDGGSLAYVANPPGDSLVYLYLVPVAGGSARRMGALATRGQSDRVRRAGLAFTPDGKSILFGKPVSEDPNMPWVGDTELFTIAIEGGAPHPAGLTLPEIRQISFAPDGRLTFTAGPSSKLEIWSMDNISTRLPD